MRREFHAENLDLEEFIALYPVDQFEIPDYQRRFVWRRQHITNFIDSIATNPLGYFIGTIVFTKEAGSSYKLQIVDGQQRLTTLTIVLKIATLRLRDYFDQIPGKDYDEDSFIKDMLTRLNPHSAQQEPRVMLNQPAMQNALVAMLGASSSNELIHTMHVLEKNVDEASTPVQNQIQKKSVLELKQIYQDIYKEIGAYSKDELLELIDKIKHLQCVYINCKNSNVVNSLFEGLNSTGLKLSTADLLRNDLVIYTDKLTPDEKLHGEVLRLWNELDDIFYYADDRSTIDKFLRHYWISENEYVSGTMLYRKIKTEIASQDDIGALQNYLKKLIRNAKIYQAIDNGSLNHHQDYLRQNKDEELYEAFNSFGQLENKQVYSVLLALARYTMDRPKGSRQIKEALRHLWKVSFIISFTPISPSKYERIFASLAKAIREIPPNEFAVDRTTSEKLNKVVSLISDIESSAIVEKISTELKYNSTKRSTRLLTRVFYDLFETYGDSGRYQDKESIEHIIPQKDTKENWGFPMTELREVINVLGNLTLLSQPENNLAGTKCFKQKYTEVYSKSMFKFNRQLNDYETGFSSKDLDELKVTVQDRTNKLAKQIYKMYSVF